MTLPPKPPPKTPPARASRSGSALYKVERLDQVRLLAHPLRLRLFEAFALGPRTTHQVAGALGLAPTRLYHHVNALERVGLLQLKETRQVRGATEKYYEAVGRLLQIEPDLFTRGPGAASGTRRAARLPAGAARSRGAAEAMVAQLLDGARADLAAALACYADTPEAMRPVATRMVVHGSPAKIAAWRRRVMKWVASCSQKTPAGKTGQAGTKKRGTASGGSRASLTLIFTVGNENQSGSD